MNAERVVERGDPCAGLRTAAEIRCTDSEKARAAHMSATNAARESRRRLGSARAALDGAERDAEPRRRAEAKQRLQDAYLGARAVATSDQQRRAALAGWAREVDGLNRETRRAQSLLAGLRGQVVAAEAEVTRAESAELAARVRAEAAAAACLEARVRLASCEEAAAAGVPGARAGAPGPGAMLPERGDAPAGPQPPSGNATSPRGPAPRPPGAPPRQAGPLVIEALLHRDRGVLAGTADALAEHTGRSVAESAMRLQELVEAIFLTATERGYVSVDPRHPLWARLSSDEARDVLRALGDLGFHVHPADGWRGGRVPVAAEVAMALAYAGIDGRGWRHPLGPGELRSLPDGVRLDADALLRSEAPDLALDRLVTLLGPHAEALGPLWEDWSQVRPILLWPAASVRRG
jgi:hypothetical protein